MSKKIQLNIELEKETLANFKIWCIKNDKSMSGYLSSHINKLLSESNK